MKKTTQSLIRMRKQTQEQIEKIKNITGFNNKEIILTAMKRIIKKHENES